MLNNVLDYLRGPLAEVPDKVAFAGENGALTFRQVDAVSASIGSAVAARGIRRAPVVVFMRKSPEEIAAFFGVIRAGCFYVPIDEEMPFARISLILKNVRAKLMICDEETMPLAASFDLCGAEPVLYSDLARFERNDEVLADVRARALDIDPIYIVFTSGSTGIPKGVCACHRSVIDYIEHLSEILRVDRTTVFGNQSPLYFDACLKELYPTLKFGATAWLIPKRLFSTPVELVRFLNEHEINTVCWVVSALTMVSAFDTFSVEIPRTLRTVAFGSEVFPIVQFNRWRAALPDADFINLYGPTEGTGMCCYYRVDRDFAEGDVIPIGRPFPNREILLLKEDGTEAKDGEEGEIVLRASSVTLGYYNDPERTAAAFVQNPLNTAYPETVYRTGDVGRWGEDGLLYFVSRRDYQIKHMGHRIELGEIEVTADGIEGVRMAACVYNASARRIVLCYIGETDEKTLLAALRGRLPRYMLPGRIVRMDSMPFTQNGKIDRVALRREYAPEDGVKGK